MYCTVLFSSYVRCLNTFKIFSQGTRKRPVSHRSSQCSKFFTRAESLRIHEKLHSGDKLYIYNSCSRSFSRADHQKAHERIHTGNKTKPFKCSHCEKVFDHNNLRNHLRSGTGGKPFICLQCSEAFRRSHR